MGVIEIQNLTPGVSPLGAYADTSGEQYRKVDLSNIEFEMTFGNDIRHTVVPKTSGLIIPLKVIYQYHGENAGNADVSAGARAYFRWIDDNTVIDEINLYSFHTGGGDGSNKIYTNYPSLTNPNDWDGAIGGDGIEFHLAQSQTITTLATTDKAVTVGVWYVEV